LFFSQNVYSEGGNSAQLPTLIFFMALQPSWLVTS